MSGQPFFVDSSAAGEPGTIWSKPLAGKTVLLTGAARGIGAATAKLLAAEGAKVVCLDRPADAEPLEALATEIGGETLLADVTDADAPAKICAALKEKHGGVDVVIHNAGITRDKTIARMTPELWEQAVDVNLGAPVPTTSFMEPDPGLRNTWTPRLGVEYRHPLAEGRELQLRAGYWFSQTPVPLQTGVTNYADANRHAGTVGGTYSFDVSGTRVGLEGAFQLQYMERRVSPKDDPTSSGGDLSVGGPIYVLSLGARVSL